MESLERIAYDLQFFEFSSSQLANERRRLIRIGVDCILDDVISHIEMPETVEQLKQKKEEVVQRMHEAFSEKLDDLDKLDKKYFTIPGHVLLENDLHNACSHNKMDENRMDETMANLKQRLMQNSVMITALKMENYRCESVSPLIDQEMSIHSEVGERSLAPELIRLHDFAKKLVSKK